MPRSLTDTQTRSIELAYYGGLTYAQVSDRLSANLATIKSRIAIGFAPSGTVWASRDRPDRARTAGVGDPVRPPRRPRRPARRIERLAGRRAERGRRCVPSGGRCRPGDDQRPIQLRQHSSRLSICAPRCWQWPNQSANSPGEQRLLAASRRVGDRPRRRWCSVGAAPDPDPVHPRAGAPPHPRRPHGVKSQSPGGGTATVIFSPRQERGRCW